MASQHQSERIIKKQFDRLYEMHVEYQYLQHKQAMIISSDDKVEIDREITEFETEIHSLALSMSRSIFVFLESNGLVNVFNVFKKEIYERLLKDTSLTKPQYNEQVGEFTSQFYDYVFDIISSFDFYSHKYIDRLMRSAGIRYLENILHNTANIIREINKDPKSEPEIYKSIKFLLLAAFDSAKQPHANFIKNFKEYKPDILIPELKTAIEFKLAKTESDLKNQVDQIAIDVSGYKGDPDYEIFYAVFYVKADFWGLPRFKQAWKEMKFPKNWKSIYVVGNNT